MIDRYLRVIAGWQATISHSLETPESMALYPWDLSWVKSCSSSILNDIFPGTSSHCNKAYSHSMIPTLIEANTYCHSIGLGVASILAERLFGEQSQSSSLTRGSDEIHSCIRTLVLPHALLLKQVRPQYDASSCRFRCTYPSTL